MPMSTAWLSRTRSTLSRLFAASGVSAFAPMMSLMCARPRRLSGLLPCSARNRSMMFRRTVLRAGLQPAKFRRAVVGNAQRVERSGHGALRRRRSPACAFTPSSAAAYWRMKSSDQGVPVR